ncbi:helix-turn-helix transcriptional regulator [Halorussus caseinilyticus]|uniref:Helix-turn-helix transcriptional regulator n=1 Tax=Halorussus caseinilyticus TaxID=3034025 RepID=A0ABD5WGZ4_9EURY|nr:helix-turn-helix domain-containing protein [Halorussus sp. DT72]
MTATEKVRFLAASEHRVETLRSLTSESLTPAALCDEHDASRATVHRILDSFEEFGWVRRGDDGYRATSAGRIVLRRFETVCETVAEVESLSGFLAQFERAHELPVPLEDYHVETSTRTDPHAASEYFIGSIPMDATQLRVLLPTVVPAFNRACEPLIERESSVQLVLSQSAAETSQQSYPDDFEQARSLECLSLFVSPETFTFGLSVFDDDVFLGGYDDTGHLRACLHSTDDDLREWALSVFRTFRNDAVTVETASTP